MTKEQQQEHESNKTKSFIMKTYHVAYLKNNTLTGENIKATSMSEALKQAEEMGIKNIMYCSNQELLHINYK